MQRSLCISRTYFPIFEDTYPNYDESQFDPFPRINVNRENYKHLKIKGIDNNKKETALLRNSHLKVHLTKVNYVEKCTRFLNTLPDTPFPLTTKPNLNNTTTISNDILKDLDVRSHPLP